ncbi:MAG: hypothetical protein KGD63_00635 [Candidatus Lokiarchaeota archaeon]|nr:hypothetical protein [Candidatus Lokiarchaeota archaeon]
MDPKEFFSIAECLVDMKNEKISEEICYRTAINRLYYGTFHLIQLKYYFKIPPSASKYPHKYVKNKIKNTKILGDYKDLEKYRVDADYHIDKKISNLHKYALQCQKRIFKNLENPYDDDDEEYYNKFHKKR